LLGSQGHHLIQEANLEGLHAKFKEPQLC